MPRALEFLGDPNPDIRASAIDALGKVVARRPDVRDALIRAAEHDADKGLRGLAGRDAVKAPTA